MNTTWEVANVRKPLISANRLLERGHKLVLEEKQRIQCKNGDTIPLERTGSLFAAGCDSEGFSQDTERPHDPVLHFAHFCPPVFDPHVQKWVFYTRRRPLTFLVRRVKAGLFSHRPPLEGPLQVQKWGLKV